MNNEQKLNIITKVCLVIAVCIYGYSYYSHSSLSNTTPPINYEPVNTSELWVDFDTFPKYEVSAGWNLTYQNSTTLIFTRTPAAIMFDEHLKEEKQP